jgi:hypothetical protein
MKIILGDNQFFGINHFDLRKGEKTKSKFDSVETIDTYVKEVLAMGLDGFMINSNEKGYELINNGTFDVNKEIHYSIPYPHKYASMVNENGMLSLVRHLINNSSFSKNLVGGLRLLISQNLASLVPLALNLEVPKGLRKGSYVFLQNIITDMLIGMGRGDIILEFVKSVKDQGYKPGLITLNPLMLDKLLQSDSGNEIHKDLIVCFNINKEGFNVFPSREVVEDFILTRPKYKLMGMSILASGAANVAGSIKYIKEIDLDYVVFGSSSLVNVKSNYNLLSL